MSLKIPILEEIFSFIPLKKKLQIIEVNKYLNNKLTILKLKKRLYFKNKIKNYEFDRVIKYYFQFKKDFGKIMKDENEIKDLLFYGLSQKENFYLKLDDNHFNKLIKNNYFQRNINIEIEHLTKEMIPRILLIKHNKFKQKTLKVLEQIFNLFSIEGKMSKTQILKFRKKLLIKR